MGISHTSFDGIFESPSGKFGVLNEITDIHCVKLGELTNDVKDGWKSEAKGGTGAAKKFLEYCDRETKTFL